MDDRIATEEKRIRDAILQLLNRGLIDERPIKERWLAWRGEAEQPIGLAITMRTSVFTAGPSLGLDW